MEAFLERRAARTPGAAFALDVLLSTSAFVDAVRKGPRDALAGPPITIMNIIDSAMDVVTGRIDDIAVWESDAMREELERQARALEAVKASGLAQTPDFEAESFSRTELAKLVWRAMEIEREDLGQYETR
jgi:hypothetical protein